MNLYEDQFSAEHDGLPFSGRPPLRYVIASTPRCGSHRLGHALAATGAMGFPLEYLNPANLRAWETRLGTSSPGDTLTALWRVRTSPNGCFGLKLHYRQLVNVAPHLSPADILGGGPVIRLRRTDLLGQAISLAKARQTGSWISAQTPVAEAVYDGDAIDKAISDIAEWDAGWDAALARVGASPLNLTFDEVISDLDGVVRRVAKHLGVEVEASETDGPPPPTRQSSRLNEEWRMRFLAEGRPVLPHPLSPAPPRPLRRLKSRLGAMLRRF